MFQDRHEEEAMNRVAVWCALTLTFTGTVHARDVGYAGFSYAGDFETVQKRFPFTSQIVPPHGSEGALPGTVERQLSDGARHLKPAGFNVVVDQLTELEGRDEAIVVILEVTDETVSTERFDDLTKLFINIRAQALFVDFKSMTVLRSYPISAVYLGALPGEPTEAKKLAKVRELIVGGEQPGLIGHFLERLAHASLPASVPRFIRVANVTVAGEAVSTLPEYFRRGPGLAETWLADEFSEAVLDEAGVSLLPYAKGYALGNTIPSHLADGAAFDFKIPVSSYSISIELRALKRVPFGEVPAGRSFIYGAYVHLLVEEPLSQHHYLDVLLKNGETKIVPVSQSTIDDWPAFQDAITGLFKKFAGTVASGGGTDEKWIKSSTTAANITQQVNATRTVLQSCN